MVFVGVLSLFFVYGLGNVGFMVFIGFFLVLGFCRVFNGPKAKKGMARAFEGRNQLSSSTGCGDGRVPNPAPTVTAETGATGRDQRTKCL